MLNWEGSSGYGFLQFGEDGKDFFETSNLLVENNLFIGNSANSMRTNGQFQGVNNITHRNNTWVGLFSSINALGMRVVATGGNPTNDNLFWYNNIWAVVGGTYSDFCDGTVVDTFAMNKNLFYNNGSALPGSGGDCEITETDDANRVVGNPLLPAHTSIVLPRWGGSAFVSGNTTIGQEFLRLAAYARVSSGSPAIDAGDNANCASTDIYQNARNDGACDIGASEFDGGSPPPPPEPPDLTVNKVHSGNFTQGQIGATYTITVSNVGGSATTGTVTVTDALPAGLTATAMSGSGWSCVLGTLTCTRSNALGGAASYPIITLTVTVADNAPSSITNRSQSVAAAKWLPQTTPTQISPESTRQIRQRSA
jgi:uncharacterized repeat protein (TIGR01451 family)